LISPAELASEIALNNLFQAIEKKKCFRFEAGAGAGKTYSLIKALRYLIDKNSESLLKHNRQIACITYTNVAVAEIDKRTDHNPAIFAGTIHAFSWSLVKGFQKQMRDYIPTISDKWKNRIEEAGGIKQQIILYDLGYPKATEEEIYLHHDDVIKIIANFLANEKFKAILLSRFPIILIDEYQDTNKLLAKSIVDNLIENDNRFLIGLFGDHWQKIYGSSACGLITATKDKIDVIGKNANFRSDRIIVEALNRMRPDLPQSEEYPDSHGEITVFLSNGWKGVRRTDNHWQGDLPKNIAHSFRLETISKLEQLGWDFTPEKTKILMLTNNVLAEEQGYSNLASVFDDPEDYLKKNNSYIAFLIDCVESVCISYEKKKYGEMFAAVGSGTIHLKKHADKLTWNHDLETLLKIRQNGTIGEIIEHLIKTERPRLSTKVEQAEKKWQLFPKLTDKDEIEKEKSSFDKITNIKSICYSELIALSKYIDDKTPFSTKHGVKGAEFENVLVVFGRGWNNYNWNDFLDWSKNGIPKGKQETFERNRNLFYVSCSRPKKRLSLLFTQFLSNSAIETLNLWFGSENISSPSFEE
jgi:DNA helicase II / ATP-dependent DNA helicase PcrA